MPLKVNCLLQMIAYGKMKFTPLWGSIVIKFSHLLLTISSALNIVIYSYKVNDIIARSPKIL